MVFDRPDADTNYEVNIDKLQIIEDEKEDAQLEVKFTCIVGVDI